MSVRSRLPCNVYNAWFLVWIQRRVVSCILPWCSAAVLAAAALVIIEQSDEPMRHFQLVCELFLPLVGAVSTAYLLSPESDPPLELLYTCPCSVPVLLGARLVYLASILFLPVSIVKVSFLATQSLLQPHYLGLFFKVWVPPTIFLGGLVLLVTQLIRSAHAGVLIGVMVWAAEILILNRICLENRIIKLLYLFPVFAGLSMDTTTHHNWVLLGLGLVFFVLGLLLACDFQRDWNSQ